VGEAPYASIGASAMSDSLTVVALRARDSDGDDASVICVELSLQLPLSRALLFTLNEKSIPCREGSMNNNFNIYVSLSRQMEQHGILCDRVYLFGVSSLLRSGICLFVSVIRFKLLFFSV
jgi:hypothetical protein